MRVSNVLFTRLFYFLMICLTAFSCVKTGDDQPTPPLPPGTGTGTTDDLGRMIQFNDTLRVYDANTGNVIVLSQPYGVAFNSARNNTTVSDSLVYQPTLNSLLAMNLNTGKRHFIKYFSGVQYSWGGVSACYPVIDGPYIFVGAYNTNSQFKLWCINKVTGATIWESNETLAFDTDDYVPSLAATDKTILVNTYDGPACFDKITGKLIWRNNLQYEYKKLGTTIRIADGKMICASAERREIFAFDVNNGQFLWKNIQPKNLYLIGPKHVWENNVYFTQLETSELQRFRVTAIDIRTGATTKSTLYPDSDFFVHFFENYLFTFSNGGYRVLPLRINKHDIKTDAIIWSRDNLGGGFLDGLVATPSYIYCPIADHTLDPTKPKKMTIIEQGSGKTVKEFQLNYNGSITPVVLDKYNKTYRQHW